MQEIRNNLHSIIETIKIAYSEIENYTGVKLHGVKGLDNFQHKIGVKVANFIEFSRSKAEKAQAREFVTIQPKENLATKTKAKITISNYLGGKYFFTVDEIKIVDNVLYIIESKSTKNDVLPSLGDIKDGLLKMILFSNISETCINDKNINCLPVLELTSKKIVGTISSNSSEIEIEDFFSSNELKNNYKQLIYKLFKEAITNRFILRIREVI